MELGARILNAKVHEQYILNSALPLALLHNFFIEQIALSVLFFIPLFIYQSYNPKGGANTFGRGKRSLFFLRRHFRVYVSGFGSRRTLMYAIRFVSLTAVRHGLRRHYHFGFLPRAPLACGGFFITTCPEEISVLNVFQIILSHLQPFILNNCLSFVVLLFSSANQCDTLWSSGYNNCVKCLAQ